MQISQKTNADFVMGYTLNLCKIHISVVPYNQKIRKREIDMALNRVRIADVADALGLSTATVSKVIHGKTEKISDETVKRVQQELERSGYIPNMAGILLARNNSRIIGVVVNDNEKYEGRILEDKYSELIKSNVTAVFAVSDFYALEFMRFLQGKGIQIPKDIQIIGFDDNLASRESNPALTTIHQEAPLRARTAIKCLEAMRDGAECETEIVLPVELIKRESTGKL